MKELDGFVMSFGYLFGFILFFIFMAKFIKKNGSDLVKPFAPGLILFVLPICIIIGMIPCIGVMVHLETQQSVKEGKAFVGSKKAESESEVYMGILKAWFAPYEERERMQLEEDIAEINRNKGWMGFTDYQKERLKTKQEQLAKLNGGK